MNTYGARHVRLTKLIFGQLIPERDPKVFNLELFEPENEVLKAYDDPERLKQVLFNLLDSAIRHTESGGKISVSSAYEGGRLAVHVSDTGTGIDPSKLGHIWERFYTEDASRHSHIERSGLGLTITKQLVERMDGTIHVESVLGQGTTFTLRLPIPPA